MTGSPREAKLILLASPLRKSLCGLVHLTKRSQDSYCSGFQSCSSVPIPSSPGSPEGIGTVIPAIHPRRYVLWIGHSNCTEQGPYSGKIVLTGKGV
jgi:hypothetical protein